MNFKKYATFLLLLILCLPLSAQDDKTASDAKITIKGQLIDNSGEPIIGANVIEEGTTNGVITDLDGRYKLIVNANSNIQFSYMGYATQTLKAKSVPSIITMKEDSELLVR